MVFADSRAALEVAWARGLPRDSRVRTFAPGLADAAGIGAERADSSLDAPRIRALEDAALELAGDLWRHFAEDDRDLAVLAAQSCFGGFHILLLKAACLSEEDFHRPIVVVDTPFDDDPNFADTFASPLPRLLAANPELAVVSVESAALPPVAAPRPPAPTLRQRLAFASLDSLLYRLLERAHRRLPFPPSRGSILVFRDNELVKETALALALRGYRLVRLEAPDPIVSGLEPEETRQLEGRVTALLAARLSGLLAPSARAGLALCFAANLARNIAAYRASLDLWRERLDRLSAQRPKAALSSVASGPVFCALHRALGERRIPLVVGQHGVTLEIHARMQRYHAIWESAVGDLALMFNREGADLAGASPMGQADTVAVGMPKDYVRGVRRRGLGGRAVPPVWYVATALYLGNRGLLFEGVADCDKALFEKGIVEEVLARLPHRVLYKPYPGNRFLDATPEIAAARAAPNIELFEERIDLRYVVGSARALITSRSFSTPSWCLMSGRPVVMIDIPDQSPLRPEAREAFARGLFLFDAGEPDFHSRLRAFLSRPLGEIEREYAAKAEARAALIERFVATGGARGAGRRAAAAVERWLAKSR